MSSFNFSSQSASSSVDSQEAITIVGISGGKRGSESRPTSSPQTESIKKKRRAMKERKRVSNLGEAYRALALTLGLYPDTCRHGQRRANRITHEQILLKANAVIRDLKNQLEQSGKMMVVNDTCPAVAQYTISSNGEVLYVEHESQESDSNPFVCDETLPLPLNDSDNSSPDIDITSAPLMSYELISPTCPQGPERNLFYGEYPRQAFFLSSPTFLT